MLPIILRIILCASIFIAVYYLFLEKEKMYRFNRIYLLSSLIVSYVIPFITITIQTAPTTKPQLIIEETIQQTIQVSSKQENLNWMNIVWVIYGIITLFLLTKSILALLAIRKIKGEKQSYQNYNIVFTPDNLSPFSFWNTIYMGKGYIKDNVIDQRIFLHEKSHLDQKHSIDLIIADLFKIFTWFNPVIFLYKKAIISNHEFLADESVLSKNINIKEYQNLILDEILIHQNPALTHSFNFNNTKKRFIMMKAKKSKFSFLKKATGIAALITAVTLFSERTYAGSPTKDFPNVDTGKVGNETETTKKTPPDQASLIPHSYFEKIEKEAKELKQEDLKAVADTLSPKKAATESKEGKNTNISTGQNENYTEAQYPEGLKGLRSQIGNRMDVGALGDFKGKTISAQAYIYIDEAGKTTNVTTSGDNELFNKEFQKTITEISNETTWKPAIKDGKAVASVLKIPATMTFTRP